MRTESLFKLAFLLFVVGLPRVTFAQSEGADFLKEETKNLYKHIPDINFETIDDSNQIKTFKLSSLWKERPLLLTLFYSECTGACSPFLRSLKAATEKIGGLGDTYSVLSLSFDPKDTPRDLSKMAENIKVVDKKDWHFGVSTSQELKMLMDSIGYWYKKMPNTDQYDHPTMVVTIKNGKISRVLIGNTVDISRFKEMVYELQGVYVAVYSEPQKDTIFKCFQVNPKTGEMQFSWGMALLFLPGVLAVFVVMFLFRSR